MKTWDEITFEYLRLLAESPILIILSVRNEEMRLIINRISLKEIDA